MPFTRRRCGHRGSVRADIPAKFLHKFLQFRFCLPMGTVYQIREFLHGRKDRITEREYWVQCKGQAKQNKEVASFPTVGQSAKPLWSLKRICFEKSDCKYLKIAYNHLGFHNNPKLNESKEKMIMSTTARMVMKIIGASLAFAAFVCLLIGGWHDIGAGYTCVKNSVKVSTRPAQRKRAHKNVPANRPFCKVKAYSLRAKQQIIPAFQGSV